MVFPLFEWKSHASNSLCWGRITTFDVIYSKIQSLNGELAQLFVMACVYTCGRHTDGSEHEPSKYRLKVTGIFGRSVG